jgi:hypothetical protein
MREPMCFVFVEVYPLYVDNRLLSFLVPTLWYNVYDGLLNLMLLVTLSPLNTHPSSHHLSFYALRHEERRAEYCVYMECIV